MADIDRPAKGDGDTSPNDSPMSPELEKSPSVKTVIAVMTGVNVDEESLLDQELNISDQKSQMECEDMDETEESTEEIRIPPSAFREAMAQIILMKKESDEEMIEVDVELDGEDPPPEFFISEDPQLDEEFQNKMLAAFPQNIGTGSAEENIESVDVICGKCGKRFNDIDALQWHLKLHARIKDIIAGSSKNRYSKNKQIYKCPECEIPYSRSSELSKHINSFHFKQRNGVLVKSEVDKEDTGTAFSLEQSALDVEDTDNETNDFELYEVTDAADKKPLIIQIIKEPNSHISADETFSDFDERQKNDLTHLEDQTYTCERCSEEFTTYFSLLRHTRMHHVNGETGILICKKCGRSFSNEEDLDDHMLEHSNNTKRKRYRCTICDKTFTHKHSLKNHMPLHTGMGKQTCPVCKKLFPCTSSLNRHIKTHSSEKQFVCEECDKAFKDAHALKKHLRIHSADRPYVCQECGASFRTQSTLSAHTVVHTKIKPFPCKECGKKFSFRSDLNRHVKLHSGVRPYQCDICPKAFYEKSRLVIHKRIHTGEKPFSCSECNEMFISSRNLARHMKIHNPTFICTICSKTYVDAYTLKIHMYKHTGERPHACSHCTKRFRTPALLKKHELTHTGIKPFICDACGRGFTSALNLKNHTTLHTGERPFRCLKCSKCFPTESTLKVHMQFHGEKEYFCDQCGKGFHRVYELKLHSITHAPQKPFSCELCSKSFCHKATYKAHMNTHTEETKYPCPCCKKIFLRSNTLRKHMKTHLKGQSRTQATDGEALTAFSGRPTGYYEESYLCTDCGGTFTDIDTLRKHLAEDHGASAMKEETELVVEEVAQAQTGEV